MDVGGINILSSPHKPSQFNTFSNKFSLCFCHSIGCTHSYNNCFVVCCLSMIVGQKVDLLSLLNAIFDGSGSRTTNTGISLSVIDPYHRGSFINGSCLATPLRSQTLSSYTITTQLSLLGTVTGTFSLLKLNTVIIGNRTGQTQPQFLLKHTQGDNKKCHFNQSDR